MTIAFIYEKIWFTNFTATRWRNGMESIKEIFRKSLWRKDCKSETTAAENVADSRKVCSALVIVIVRCSSLTVVQCVYSSAAQVYIKITRSFNDFLQLRVICFLGDVDFFSWK